jgi:hypothetical protein
MHATIAAWDGDRLTLWDKTQWVHNVADEIAAVFGIPAEHIRVVSPFVGGAFGSGLRTWPHVTLAALGARVAGRPVKLMLSRREMYYGVGYRPHTVQRVALGASQGGRLAAAAVLWRRCLHLQSTVHSFGLPSRSLALSARPPMLRPSCLHPGAPARLRLRRARGRRSPRRPPARPLVQPWCLHQNSRPGSEPYLRPR